MTRRFAALVCAAAILFACGDSATPDGGDDPPPGPAVDVGGLWVLRSGHSSSGEIAIARGVRITMEINGDQMRGSAGCNSYGGGVSVEGDSFDAGGLALTEIGCPQEIAENETLFVEAMGEVDTVEREGRSLTLTGPESELAFRLVPPVDPKPLTGTEWILDSLVQGPGASGSVSSARPARLFLEDDGTFEGTTGCRTFTGTWEVLGDVVTVNSMVFEGACPKAGADQNAHVSAVLGTGFRAERDGDLLTLTAEKGDLGLVYRAR